MYLALFYCHQVSHITVAKAKANDTVTPLLIQSSLLLLRDSQLDAAANKAC